MEDNPRNGAVHYLWPNTNACICGWVSAFTAPGVSKAEWNSHQASAISRYPANHQALVTRIPGSRSRSPHFEMNCSCGHHFLMKDATPFFFYTIDRMCHDFDHHVGKARDVEALVFADRNKALEAAAIQKARLDEADRIRSSIKERFVLDE